mgnify:CR=1 FL=1
MYKLQIGYTVMNTIPRNIPYVPTFQEHLNLIKYLHLEGNMRLRDNLIYHLSITSKPTDLQTVYLGELVGFVRVSRMHMLIKLCKSIGVY